MTKPRMKKLRIGYKCWISYKGFFISRYGMSMESAYMKVKPLMIQIDAIDKLTLRVVK